MSRADNGSFASFPTPAYHFRLTPRSGPILSGSACLKGARSGHSRECKRLTEIALTVPCSKTSHSSHLDDRLSLWHARLAQPLEHMETVFGGMKIVLPR